jgi:LysR family nitrogen assimilation transcriptional regulator
MLRTIAHLSGLSLERLASLCEVAEAGSIGQAARGDGNRQSLLSRQIGDLEAVFGVALLARDSRPYRLTKEGRELEQAARAFFQATDDFRRRIRRDSLRIVIGAGEFYILKLLFPATEALPSGEVGMNFCFKNLDSQRLADSLLNGTVDVGLLRIDEVPLGCECTEPLVIDYVAFIPKKLSKASGPVQMAELCSLPWAVLEGAGHARSFIAEQAKSAGGELRVAVECSSYAQVESAVRTKRYAGLLPSFAVSSFLNNGEILVRQLERKWCYRRSLVLAWKASRANSRPALVPLVEEIRQAFDRICV